MYFRKVIHISALDSPNVALALLEKEQGKTPSDTQVLPGVLSWVEYERRRATWDKVRQCVSLDGQFYEGGEVLLYPPAWLNLAEERHRELIELQTPRRAKAIGVDTAEGGDNTAWAVVDELGLIHLQSFKTPDTSKITGITIALMRQYEVQPNFVFFDRGGGGFQHVSNLNAQGYRVNSVMFGESVAPEPTRFMKLWDDKLDERKEQTTFKNRRAQMYWLLRSRLDPSSNKEVFAIPAGQHGDQYTELRKQLAPIPLWYDAEGRMLLPPKRKPSNMENTNTKTMVDLIGHSPDEADALALAMYGLEPGSQGITISPLF